MKYYLAGPMDGISDRNFPMFNRAAKWLREAGYEVMNPAELNTDYLGKGRSVCMRRNIEYVMQCDGILLLPGWMNSQGVVCEYAVATQIGLATFALMDTVNGFVIMPFLHSQQFTYEIVSKVLSN